jgi:hypothetical protein
MRIHPNICVDFGTQDVPEPSCDIGSARSVVDRMSGPLIDMPSIAGEAAAGVDDATGNGVAGSVAAGVGLAGGLVGLPLGVDVAAGLGAGDIVAAGFGFAGRIVIPGIGPIDMPGIGAMVDCADAAAAACSGTIAASATHPMHRQTKNTAIERYIYYDA